MAAPKIRTSHLGSLYQGDSNQNLHDKKIVESLIKRLNEKIQFDVDTGKKAALIIENWLKKTKP